MAYNTAAKNQKHLRVTQLYYDFQANIIAFTDLFYVVYFTSFSSYFCIFPPEAITIPALHNTAAVVRHFHQIALHRYSFRATPRSRVQYKLLLSCARRVIFQYLRAKRD